MRAGAVILTLLLALLSIEASGSEAVPVQDNHGEAAIRVSSHAPVCPDDVTLRHQCCLAICGSLMPAQANTLVVEFRLLRKVNILSDLAIAETTDERLYRPPKV